MLGWNPVPDAEGVPSAEATFFVSLCCRCLVNFSAALVLRHTGTTHDPLCSLRFAVAMFDNDESRCYLSSPINAKNSCVLSRFNGQACIRRVLTVSGIFLVYNGVSDTDVGMVRQSSAVRLVLKEEN